MNSPRALVIGWLVIALAAVSLLACQSPAEWRATQEKWAEQEGLICDPSHFPVPVTEHVAASWDHSAAQRVCGIPTRTETWTVGNTVTTITTSTTGCTSYRYDPDEWGKVVGADIYYSEGDVEAMCHERTHVYCGPDFHDKAGRFDRRLLAACYARLRHLQPLSGSTP